MTISINCLVDSQSTVGEGPLWDSRIDRLWWVDIPLGVVYRFNPSSGHNEHFVVGEPVGCMALRDSGGLVLATKTGFYFYDADSGKKVAITDPEADQPDNRFNDGGTDRQGRFWAGTMFDGAVKSSDPHGAFYRLDESGSTFKGPDGFFTTNGLAFSPDGATMYFSESNASIRTVWRCDYDQTDGVPSEREVFLDTSGMPGRPDGGTVDTDGCYWMAAVSGWQLVRITPEGKIDQVIDLPIERPSKPMFGGPDLKTLFVTSISAGLTPGSTQPLAGGLFAVEGTGAQGVAEVPFFG